MREMCCLDDDALYFVVSGAKLRFGLDEFALITGLQYKDGTSIMIKLVPNRLVKNIFFNKGRESNRGDSESSNADMKKELESFRVHVDSKFIEILIDIVDLKKKVDAKCDLPDEKEDAFAYSGGLHTNCVDLNMDDNQGVCEGDENVKDVTPNDGVGGGDSSKEVGGGGVVDGIGGGEGHDSYSDFMFVLMSESVIAAITQNESDIAAITQAAKVGVASTEVVEDEQFIKDDCPENTTVNAVVTEQAREDVLPQGGDVESPDAGNESVDDGESALAPPPEDVARPQTGQLTDEGPGKTKDIVKDCGVSQSGVSGGTCDSKEQAPDFVIPPDTNLVEINDDQTTR
ncbi:hypothetical protein RND71_011627 [Anisodus tanguticus]|uniref:Uncharacterized protein n=1 Tax=Anisodus tanguticus TaxID=243964 RepID=A0AAE1SDN6_9SOLA|nr:hypothetical protein RND71_011627 [Anisodus tanguticus]